MFCAALTKKNNPCAHTITSGSTASDGVYLYYLCNQHFIMWTTDHTSIRFSLDRRTLITRPEEDSKQMTLPINNINLTVWRVFAMDGNTYTTNNLKHVTVQTLQTYPSVKGVLAKKENSFFLVTPEKAVKLHHSVIVRPMQVGKVASTTRTFACGHCSHWEDRKRVQVFHNVGEICPKLTKKEG
jgi:hypothetical protein